MFFAHFRLVQKKKPAPRGIDHSKTGILAKNWYLPAAATTAAAAATITAAATAATIISWLRL